jgi:hypothetical protein
MKRFSLELTIEAESEEEAIAIARRWMNGDPQVHVTEAKPTWKEEVTYGVTPTEKPAELSSLFDLL